MICDDEIDEMINSLGFCLTTYLYHKCSAKPCWLVLVLIQMRLRYHGYSIGLLWCVENNSLSPKKIDLVFGGLFLTVICKQVLSAFSCDWVVVKWVLVLLICMPGSVLASVSVSVNVLIPFSLHVFLAFIKSIHAVVAFYAVQDYLSF